MKKKLSSNSRFTPISLWSNIFLSNWFFLWCFPLAYRALSTPFEKMVFYLRKWEAARFNGDKLQAAWQLELKEAQKSGKKASILKTLRTVYGLEYALIGLYKFFWGIFTWLCAYYFLKLILVFVQQKEDYLKGHMIALALFLSAIFSSISIHQLYGECNRISVQVKAALTVLIYRKSLRLSRVRGGAGEVINILSTDMTRIHNFIVNFHFLWSAFLEVAAIVVISFYEIGLSAFPALGFILILTPLQMYLGKRTSYVNRMQTMVTTQRVHLMSEILTAIKLIKFYAWEMPFASKIDQLRKKENDLIFENMMIKTLNFTMVFAVPVLIALASLGMYVGLGNKLTAPISFTVLSVYNTLRYPFFMLPMAVSSTVSAMTAFKRLDEFFDGEEVEEIKVSEPSNDKAELAFEMKEATFKWDGADCTTLSDVTLSIKKGEKVAIIGDVGSGKSSLIAAILGQIRQIDGEKLKIYGSSSYVPQQAWLLNMTLRENILFGKPLDRVRYKEVIRVCSLQRDLTLLVAGDQTELAERGANLSGGQRQRCSLARAVYADADIILLDDPISAVDQHVGRHIFEECFMKFLGKKTVVVSLNQLQYLPEFDQIIVVRKGRIHQKGTFEELMKNDDFAELISNHMDGGEQGEVDDDPVHEVQNDASFDPTAESSKVQHTVRSITSLPVEIAHQLTTRTMRDFGEKDIVEAVERSQGTILKGASKGQQFADLIAQNEISVYSTHDVKMSKFDKEAEEDALNLEKGKLVVNDTSAEKTGFEDFKNYFRTKPGTLVSIAICIFFSLVHGVRIASDYWLRLWIPRIGGFSDAVYLGVYGGSVGLFALGVFLRGYLFTLATCKKSSTLHENLFNAVMRAPMSFFDTTPLGRILSAFSKHQLHVDDTMPDAAMQMLQYLPLGLGAMILAAVLIPWNYIPTIAILIFAILFVKFSNPAIDKTKSLEAVTKAPIYAHVSTTLEGLFSIRSYHAEDRFDTLNIEKLDRNHEALLAMTSVRSFQAFYLDVLSSFVVYFTSMLVVLYRDADGMASTAGLALSNVLQMLVFVQWTIRMYGEVNAQMASVGQLVYYAGVEPEAPAKIPATEPHPSWPDKGLIKFENIVLRYHKFGVDVLKKVSFDIKPSEKIGIVGRTGSGKSTLLVSLLRIVEAAEGKVTIDGVDVKTLGLADLRSRIAIIPQEPVLFVGTVRSNLDPFSKSTDEEIWKALHAVNLGDTIASMNGKLDSAVVENGANFSLGQRQCFCIARAILAKTKVLVLDEATAAIDMTTDLFIQKTIKEAFSDLTVLTIAHRLNTIIESDRVMVMEAGQLVEFDEPIKLLDKPDGIFRSLVEQTGEQAAAKLREFAEEASRERRRQE